MIPTGALFGIWQSGAQINVAYKPLHVVEVTPGKINRHTGMPREGFPEAYWRRLCAFAAKLEREYAGKKVGLHTVIKP
eukprot:5993964-Pyramimonas_sp.AAC.1